MTVLACDSCSGTASAALCDGSRLISEASVTNGNTHTETLMPLIETALRTGGVSVSEIDLFACTSGPGSFTGVRIGVATVKGLALGRGVPCAGVSSLEALAYAAAAEAAVSAAAGCLPPLILPLLDARRGQFYTALFEPDGGLPLRLTDDEALDIGKISSMLAEDGRYAGRPVLLCGDGAAAALPGLPAGRCVMPPPHRSFISPYYVAQAALAAHSRGQSVTDAALLPSYLRIPQAERDRLEKLKGPGTAGTNTEGTTSTEANK